jgi:TonB-dependent starch-binding outer membrane protein SusC
MRKLFLLGFLYLCTCVWNNAWAQERTIIGKVTSLEDNSPLPGANVVVKGTTRGVNTDQDGNYKIVVNGGVTLVYSFVGFEAKEVSVGNQSVINMTLATDSRTLNEVVVTALGI